MKKEVITLRIDKNLKDVIDKKALELNISRTDLIINAITNQDTCYVDKLKDIVQNLIILNNTIIKKEREDKEFYDTKDIIDIKKGVNEIWRTLR